MASGAWPGFCRQALQRKAELSGEGEDWLANFLPHCEQLITAVA